LNTTTKVHQNICFRNWTCSNENLRESI